MAPVDADLGFARVVHDLDTGLKDADVVMALRIQRERINDLDGIPDIGEYSVNFGISETRLKKAKPDAIVMHPGPMNRGIEIDGALADSKRSVITRQVTNGVAVRMAVLAHVARSAGRA
jgi:aspartate carbamoyltransferase catalytic subunit